VALSGDETVIANTFDQLFDGAKIFASNS
jgi:hypothetical protein